MSETRSGAGKRGGLPMVGDGGASTVVSVYDPAMCCSTGVCGPEVDEDLMRATSDLRWLESEGVGVERFNLAQEPDAFVANPRVTGLMQAFGEGALPAVLVNGEVFAYGRYPSREELVEALGSGAPREGSSGEGGESSGSCCGPGSGCC